ncbi:MAG: rhodanese-like domain-containing protein [Eubacteriales bacterium]|nr:rhodanese-like domain-containing protein [Eubacteriales bacterium]
MRKKHCLLIVLLLWLLPVLAACSSTQKELGAPPTEPQSTTKAEEASATPKGEAVLITAEEAKAIMDNETGYIILDVRTQEEFNTAHIPGAVLIPDDELEARAEMELPDKAQQLLLYCRTGRRSAAAAKLLISMGYTNVKDFGGITTWPYETVAP